MRARKNPTTKVNRLTKQANGEELHNLTIDTEEVPEHRLIADDAQRVPH
jgi:hypothetical protein